MTRQIKTQRPTVVVLHLHLADIVNTRDIQNGASLFSQPASGTFGIKYFWGEAEGLQADPSGEGSCSGFGEDPETSVRARSYRYCAGMTLEFFNASFGPISSLPLPTLDTAQPLTVSLVSQLGWATYT